MITELPVRVALVDDHRLLAQSLALALQDAGFDAVLVDPAHDVVARVKQWKVGVVLLDLHLGEVRDGDELIPSLVGDGRQVVVLTSEQDPARWGRCLLAGAVGVVPKSSPLVEVVAAVRAAAAGDPVNRERERVAWRRAADRQRGESERALAPFRTLTPRETAVLAALVEGLPAFDIARTAVVSEATVRSQIKSVLAKLGVSSQLQAVARARRAGWRASDLRAGGR